MKDLISIVIPTYNEQGRIGPTLDQLHKYASKEKLNIEVLVVDARSPDDTIKEVNAHSKVFNKIRVIDATRNLVSKAKYILNYTIETKK